MYSFVIGSPAENAYIAASTSEEKMARAFSVTEIGYPLGLIFSPFLGAYLVGIMDMRWLFRISFLISIISMLPLFFVSSQIPQRKEKTHKPLGEFLSPLRNKSFIILMPIFILIASSVTMMVTFLSPVLQDLHKLDSSFVLALGSVLSTGEVSLGILFGWIGDHWGAFIALSLSLIAVSASAFLLAFPLPFVLVAFTIFLMGAQRSAMALPRSIIGRCSSNISSGAMFGIYGAIMGITQTFVPVLAGMIYGFSPTQLFLFTGSISLAIIPLVFVTEKRFGALRKARVKEA
jgi:predicted MFS family arabinose efflux permease